MKFRKADQCSGLATEGSKANTDSMKPWICDSKILNYCFDNLVVWRLFKKKKKKRFVECLLTNKHFAEVSDWTGWVPEDSTNELSNKMEYIRIY